MRASSLDFFNTLICPIIQFSKTVLLLNKLKFWNTMPTLLRYVEASKSPLRIFCPLNRISPASGTSRRLIHLSNVLFPDPLEPIIVTTLPRSIVKLISLRTRRSPKCFSKCLISITVSISFLLKHSCP